MPEVILVPAPFESITRRRTSASREPENLKQLLAQIEASGYSKTQQRPSRSQPLSLFNELKRRNVLRVGAAYIVTSWLVIQVVETLFPIFNIGNESIRIVVLILAIGLVPALFIAWAFELTPEGLKREADVDRSQSIPAGTSKKLDRWVIAMLVLALAYFVFDKFILDPARDAELVDTTAAMTEKAVLNRTPEKSIAVLPFANMSSDRDQEYFSDGITEEILNLLVKIPELKVTSRTSVFTFKGQNVDIPTVAEKLGVAHILEGSVRKANDRVRITTQLIEAGNDVHLWSETYERKLDDIFAIQDEIAREVVKALRVQLLGEAPIAASTNTEAYNQYLKGKHFATLGRKGMESSINAYQESIALDADFAPAWAGLSDVLRWQGQYGDTDLHEAMEASRRAAMRALELDNELAEAWLSLAEIQFAYDWDWPSADETIRTALEYGPKNALVLRQVAWMALSLGDAERALGFAQLAVDLDPLEFSGLANLAATYWALGKLKDEEQIYRKIMELYPDYSSIKAFLAAALARQGKPEEGLQYLDFDSESRWHRSMSVMVLHSLERHEEELRIRKDMIDGYSQTWPAGIAMTYAWHGDRDKAFEWLNIAFEQRSNYMTNLLINPWLAPLHDDPRWEKILEKMELLEYWEKSQARLEDAE